MGNCTGIEVINNSCYVLHIKDNDSDKFWILRVIDDAYSVTYGKSGTQGRTLIKEFKTKEECLKQAKKQVELKMRKGYQIGDNEIVNQRIYVDTEDFGLHPITSHPYFTAHFMAEFYYDCGDEEAPFGSDEGADTLGALEEYIREHKAVDMDEFPIIVIERQWGMTFYPPIDVSIDGVKQQLQVPGDGILTMSQYLYMCDQVIVASAFGQIKIMGRVSGELKDMALKSLKRMAVLMELDGYGESEYLETMTADLVSFANS